MSQVIFEALFILKYSSLKNQYKICRKILPGHLDYFSFGSWLLLAFTFKALHSLSPPYLASFIPFQDAESCRQSAQGISLLCPLATFSNTFVLSPMWPPHTWEKLLIKTHQVWVSRIQVQRELVWGDPGGGRRVLCGAVLVWAAQWEIWMHRSSLRVPGAGAVGLCRGSRWRGLGLSGKV